MSGRPLDPVQQKRAMEDPEIVSILQDPAMNKVLQDLQRDPKAGAKYLNDPIIQEKLNTLIYAGIVRMGYSVCFYTMGIVVNISSEKRKNRRYECFGRRLLYREA